MQNYAQKLMTLRKTELFSPNLSVIFGTVQNLAKTIQNQRSIRIGMWPTISSEQPEIALGFSTVLALLLEQWQEIMVYRLFARLDGDPSAYQWDLSHSQFGVDDWHIESLDDNVGLWSRLNQGEDGWNFEIDLENDLGNSEEIVTFSYTAPTLVEILNWLPEAATQIAGELGAELRSPVYNQYQAVTNELPEALLRDLTQWELALNFHLWGKPVDFEQQLDQILTHHWDTSSDFAMWTIVQSVARGLLPGFISSDLSLSDAYDRLLRLFSGTIAATIFADALYATGASQLAIDLLEETLLTRADDSQIWLMLTNLYRTRGDLQGAVDAFQRAFDAGVDHANLYVQYGQLLPLMDLNGWKIEEFILIDPDDYTDHYITWEAIAAYEQAIVLTKESQPNLLTAQLLLLAEVDMPLFWGKFQTLVNSDPTGEQIRLVTDSLMNVDEIEPALEILENAVDQHPKRPDLRLSLAVSYIFADEHDAALEQLEAARHLTEDLTIYTDIEHLTLMAEDPEFEQVFGEITDKVNAGGRLSKFDLEFLEDVIADAPHYIDAYILLARGFLNGNSHEAAIQHLLDAVAFFPEDPDVLDNLGRALWLSGQQELAFTYLKKGLTVAPMHLPLLTFIARCLFENNEHDAAREYLKRAEALSPRHPELVKVRQFIANQLQDEE
ncbi:MAG: hypothetical protein MUF87_04980 [Anaerolineae bacterium]|nr:hypothetical protein [Anaerolineae bacterium]